MSWLRTVKLLGTLSLSLCSGALTGAAEPRAFVNRIVIDGTINPAGAEFIAESIQQSHDSGADALVVQLDTPGGLLSSTRLIVKNILGAPVPVIVYVAPSGASAASAGTFITLSAHVAAMAPGTSIGAAHPVGVGGKEVEGVMGEKLENFVASYGEAIAQRRGRNVNWAVKSVRESAAADAVQAVKLKVVDFIAANVDQLLSEANGRTVEVNGKKIALALAGAEVRTLEMTASQRFVDFIANPTIAYFLLMVGILGLYLEFSNPGLIFPGVAGAICLLLAAMAFQVLPINYTGLLLIVLGVVLLIAELFVTSFGILGIGGIVCFGLGSFILFDRPGETLALPRGVVLTATATLGAGILTLGYLVVKSQRRQPALGDSGMIGATGEVIERIAPIGKIRVHGEIWTAKSNETIECRQKALVENVRGLQLLVRQNYQNEDPSDSRPAA